MPCSNCGRSGHNIRTCPYLSSGAKGSFQGYSPTYSYKSTIPPPRQVSYICQKGHTFLGIDGSTSTSLIWDTKSRGSPMSSGSNKPQYCPIDGTPIRRI